MQTRSSRKISMAGRQANPDDLTAGRAKYLLGEVVRGPNSSTRSGLDIVES
jgi:hypothetical protein